MPYITLTDRVWLSQVGAVVQFGVIDQTFAAPGNAIILAAVAGRIIRVLAVTLGVTAAVQVRFQGDGVSLVTGPFPLAATGGFTADRQPPNFFYETVAGENLRIAVSGACTVGGTFNFVVL